MKLSYVVLGASTVAALYVRGDVANRHHQGAVGTGNRPNKRHVLSRKEADAFLWVEQELFKRFARGKSEPAVAKARAEIATARAFGIKPSNRAKRDMGIFVETDKRWQQERNDVERRLAAASKRRGAEETNLIVRYGQKADPGKMAGLYWFETAADYKPSDMYYPLAVARDAERKVERERENLYHKYHKETPEERIGGALAILLTMVMLDSAAGEGLGAEAEAALGELGEAEATLAVTETEAASTAIMNARSILIASEDSAGALASVEQARSALNAGEIEGAAAAVAEARSQLASLSQVNPAVALALASADKSITRLTTARAEDAEIGIKEHSKIEIFEHASAHDDEVRRLLAADQKLAVEYMGRYRAMVVKGTHVPSAPGTIP